MRSSSAAGALHHDLQDGEWAVLGVSFALHLFAFRQPVDSRALAAHDLCEPETAALVRRWVTDRTLVDLASNAATVEEVLATVGDDVADAARSRAIRERDGHDVRETPEPRVRSQASRPRRR